MGLKRRRTILPLAEGATSDGPRAITHADARESPVTVTSGSSGADVPRRQRLGDEGIMATQSESLGLKPHLGLAPDTYERALAVAAVALLVAVLAALVRGNAQWGPVPGVVWAHLLTIVAALVLTPVMLLRPRGSATHRRLGRMWVAAMLASALISFGVGRGWSPIHALSALVTLGAPWIWWTARQHRVAAHRRAVRGMVTGALLIAGFFTFPFDRMLGSWLLG
jgi:uncharacterized membrane protein